MNTYKFTFHGAALEARGARSLFWPEKRLLCVSDLHLGKADRVFRRGGTILPPYENLDTIERLGREIQETGAQHIVCLGDSFDDSLAAAQLPAEERRALQDLAENNTWTWIAGNHDPSAGDLPGDWREELRIGSIIFRHIADPAERGEISGHYHPKARPPVRGAGSARACFLIDNARIVLPAFGTYTGGLHSSSPELCGLMAPDARAVLTGKVAHVVPMPREKRVARRASSLST